MNRSGLGAAAKRRFADARIIPTRPSRALARCPYARGGAGLDDAGIAAALAGSGSALARGRRQLPGVSAPSFPGGRRQRQPAGRAGPPPPGLLASQEFGAPVPGLPTCTDAARRSIRAGPARLPDPQRARQRPPLVWLDNAATTQKPHAVIDRLAYFYAHENSNIHRAAHELAARATDAYEAARDKGRALSQCAIGRTKSSSCAAPPRRSIWWHRAGAGSNRRGRRDRRQPSRTPRQHRALAAARRGEGGEAARHPGRRQRPDPARRIPQLLSPRTSCVASPRSPTRSARSTPVQEDRRHGACGRREGAGRWRAGGVAHARRRAGPRLPTSTSSPGHKVFAPTGIGVALRQAKICSTRCLPGRAAAT